jgi:hypothetical protein
MTNIISNGSHWAGEDPSPIADLEEALKTEPLDRSLENYGNFIIQPTVEHDRVVRFWGNFFGVSHVFSIDTDEPEVIEHLTALIRTNQKRPDYRSQPRPKRKKAA